MSAVVLYSGAFDIELYVGGVGAVGSVYTEEEREGIFKGAVLVSLTKIVLVTS